METLALPRSQRAVAIACFMVCVSACSDGQPIVTETHELPSPDGRMAAVVEVVDNGLGFGLGALYEEVHVIKAGDAVNDHGASSNSLAFYIESNYGKGKHVAVTWVSPTQLRIEFDGPNKPGKTKLTVAGITIEYIRNT